MILYHSSNEEVRTPDLNHSREYLDFGRGFYLTTLKDQAIKYADRFRLRGLPSILNVYEFPDELKKLNVLTFDSYDVEWLDFVGKCRAGGDISEYDVVQGGIADDKIFRTIDLYFAGDISKNDALKKLKMEIPNHQICLRTTKALSLLAFVESIKL